MGATAIKIEDRRYSMDEYLDLVEKLEGKYEYHEGRLVDWRMMAGTTEPHVLIAANLIRTIGNGLQGSPCRVYGSDLLVRIANKSRYRFPDIAVVCGPTQFDTVDKGRRRAISNPTVLIEILSDSSEKTDRGEKFEEYRQIPSIKEYVLVSQHKPLIEVFRRHDDGTWGILAIVQEMSELLDLKALSLRIPLSDIYSNVTFPPPEPEPAESTDSPQI